MSKRSIVTAGIFGALAVGMGAFGAHSLKSSLAAGSLEIWEKAVQYQFYHTFALMFLAFATDSRASRLAYWLFTIGIILFSGSLYLLALRDLANIGFVSILGPITPLGGLCFISGWAALLWINVKKQ
jgi:uncharacterized membrane protein YgdD (TMEM256/DUF423 family)